MILIADGGATKVDWMATDGIVQCTTSGLNPYYLTSQEIATEIITNLKSHVNKKIQAIYFYGTGVTDALKAETVKKGIELAFGYKIPVQAESDVVGAAVSLFGANSGIACILGTGSNTSFWDGHKIARQVPPLGFWLGDEGSGAYLGKLLMLDYLHQEMPNEIRQKFEVKYGKIDRVEVLKKSSTLPSKYFAEFSMFIFKNRDETYIRALIMKSFHLFFHYYLLKYPNISEQNIGFVGSVGFYYQDFIGEIAKEHKLSKLRFLQKPIEGLVEFHKKNNL